MSKNQELADFIWSMADLLRSDHLRPPYGLAVEAMRAPGRRIDDEVLAHISPAHNENVNFFGSIAVDVERELTQLDPTGYRPLQEPPTRDH